MQSLFGLSLSPVMTYVIAVIIIVGLLALFALILPRVLGARMRLSGAPGRTRQPRLGIVDIYDLDRQRQLVLLRRDNVEHLLLIGGPNDVLVESAIVRSPARASQPPMSPPAEAMDRQGAPGVPAASFQELESAVAAAVAPIAARPAPGIAAAEPAEMPSAQPEPQARGPEPYVRGSAMPTFPVRPIARPASSERQDTESHGQDPVFPAPVFPAPVRPPLTQEIPRANLRPADVLVGADTPPPAFPEPAIAAPAPQTAVESARASVARGFGSLFGRALSSGDKQPAAEKPSPLPERAQPRFDDLMAQEARAHAHPEFDEPAEPRRAEREDAKGDDTHAADEASLRNAADQPAWKVDAAREGSASEGPAEDEPAQKRPPAEFSIPDDIARKLEEALQRPYTAMPSAAEGASETPAAAAPSGLGTDRPRALPEPFPATSSPFPPEEPSDRPPAPPRQPEAADRPAAPAKPVEQKQPEAPAAPKAPAGEEAMDPFSVEAIEAEFARLLGRASPPKSSS